MHLPPSNFMNQLLFYPYREKKARRNYQASLDFLHAFLKVYLLVFKSSMELMFVMYFGTARPILAPFKFGPKSSNFPL